MTIANLAMLCCVQCNCMAKKKARRSRTVKSSVRDDGRTQFPLSSEDCELLCALQSTASLRELAVAVRKDASVLSRQLAAIATKAPVLEKIQGRWALTAMGQDVVKWAQDSIRDLEKVFDQRSILKIATTREFGAKVLAPGLKKLLALYEKDFLIHVVTSDDSQNGSVEKLILNGEAECGIDCGRPRDPLIAFRFAMEERFGIYAAPRLFGKAPGVPKTLEELLGFPCLQYTRMPASRYLELEREVPLTAGYFNDLATLAEACAQGMGWAVLPSYAVKRKIEAKRLVALDLKPIAADHFGVWWLRSRKQSEELVRPLLKWLGARG